MNIVLPLLALGCIALFLCVLYLLIRPVVRGAIYFPTKPASVQAIVEMSGARPGERVVDIGSGDGRIVIAFAERGIEAHGYEINPLLVASSRRVIQRTGLQKFAFIHRKDLWKADFAEFDVIVIYCMPRFLRDLERKIEKEARPGTRVISNIYPLPTWQPEAVWEKVFLYRTKEKCNL